jgi:hypothetical protein
MGAFHFTMQWLAASFCGRSIYELGMSAFNPTMQLLNVPVLLKCKGWALFKRHLNDRAAHRG